jgi:hypothetical protein
MLGSTLSLLPAARREGLYAVKLFGRFLLIAGLALPTASALLAQRFVSSGSYSSFSGNGFGGGYGYPNYGWASYGWGYGSIGFGYGDLCLQHPQEHPPFGVGYAHGDPDFIQSTFMDYEKALALGKKILEEQAKPQPSLGEIARQLRQRARSYVPAPAPRANAAPSGDFKKWQIIEDSHGTPILCRAGNKCRSNT